MTGIKTRPTDADVTAFLDSVLNEARRSEGHALRTLCERVADAPVVMWGPSIVGFGTMTYTNTTGTHDWFGVGFSPRKTALTIYGVVDGSGPPDPLRDELGPHTTGKGCLSIKRLDRVTIDVVEQLIRNARERASAA